MLKRFQRKDKSSPANIFHYKSSPSPFSFGPETYIVGNFKNVLAEFT